MAPEKALELAVISSRSKFELVLDQLSRLIRSGSLKDGDSLPSEEALCSMLGVGRSSVREVLRALETMGLLQRTRQGTRIINQTHVGLATLFAFSIQLGEVETEDLVRIRRLLEGEAAALAAERAGSDDARELRDLLREMETFKQEPEAFVRTNVAFHLRIAQASHNSLLYGLVRSMSTVLTRYQAGVADQDGVPDIAIAQHTTILEAIEHRDPVAARALMEEHVEAIARTAVGGSGRAAGPGAHT